jgi:hypothetical protein
MVSFMEGTRETKQCQLAKISWTLGILSLLTCITAIPAIFLGHLALRKIKQSSGQLQGDEKARWGIVMGYVAILLFAVFSPLGHLIPSSMEDARFAQMRDTGVDVYKAIFSTLLDENPDSVFIGYPQPGQFQTSTEYFRAVIADDTEFPEDALFDKEGKARFCVVEGISGSITSTPFIFSANLLIQRTDEPWSPEDIELLFKRKAIVVINKGGLGLVIKNKALEDPKIFNPKGESYKVLRP